MRFALWQLLQRVWERQAGATMRGVAFAQGGDPGELMFEALEIVSGQGEKRHWEMTKSRALAQALAQAMGGGGAGGFGGGG